jgi:thiosulfate/3-mercaptopyruvate sulfurtransferase
MLDGGFTSWCAAGLTTNRTPGSNPPGDIELSGGHLPVIDGDQAAALARSGVLLDSRIRPNYIGGRVAPGNPARGHIPGAISAPAADNLGDPGTFTDNDTLSTLYAALGADGSKPIGVYCGVGISATHDIAALAMLGLDAALFPGSWSAWASDPTRPVIIGAKPE